MIYKRLSWLCAKKGVIGLVAASLLLTACQGEQLRQVPVKTEIESLQEELQITQPAPTRVALRETVPSAVPNPSDVTAKGSEPGSYRPGIGAVDPSQSDIFSGKKASKPAEKATTATTAPQTAYTDPASTAAKWTGDAAGVGAGNSLSPGNNVLPGVKCFDVTTVRNIISGATGNTLGGKYIFLTFDDGVNWKSTPRILDMLARERVSATFFIVGRTLGDNTAPLLRRIAGEGHAVGVHSFDHNYEHLYPGRVANPNEIYRQAEVTLERMRHYLGPQFSTRLWRYPGGHMSWNNMEAGDNALLKLGLIWLDWNGMAGLADIPSRRPKDVPGVLDYMIKSTSWSPTREVYVMLLHDTADKLLIPEALPTIIKHYRDLGFEFAVLK